MIFKKKNMVVWLALVVLSFTGIAVAQAQDSVTFRIITEEFPPYNFTTADGQVTGISTDIVRRILKKLGQSDNIEVMSWTAGYQLAREQDNVILFSTTRSPAREQLFKWVGPLVPNDSAFFARSNNSAQIKTIDDARKVERIGVYQDDFGELLLKEKGFTNLDTVLENRTNVPRLLSGEIDLWIANELTGRYMIAQASADDQIKKVLAVQKDNMYIAFSRNTPDEVIVRWQQILDGFKADGTYGQIFVQWMNRLY